jgi:hypothetical protein
MPALAGASAHAGKAGRVHQEGQSLNTSHAFIFAPVHLDIQRVTPCFVSIEAPMDQMELRLMCRLDAPSVVAAGDVARCKSYRDAVRWAWQSRRVRNMTRRTLAEIAGLYAPHVSCYLSDDESKRSLPADKVPAFETAVGNCFVSQWLAAQAKLTILEEVQAERRAA